ncbi:MAG: hypothetical protein KJO07_14685 [Deltaproteobacteria bacterium]|nr:hypothetical protein [Deltaproteobacteria bacterium]
MTAKRAKELFRESRHARLGHGYSEDYCEHRADVAVAALERQGVTAYKVVLTRGNTKRLEVAIPGHPAGGVSWQYHVAPAVRVDGELWVLDPVLFRGPVRVDRWAAKMGGEAAPPTKAKRVEPPRDERLEYPRLYTQLTDRPRAQLVPSSHRYGWSTGGKVVSWPQSARSRVDQLARSLFYVSGGRRFERMRAGERAR